MRSSLKWLVIVCAWASVGFAAPEKTFNPVDLNTISRVEITSKSVTIIGTDKPNFTTFTMNEPARLVIDISEAIMSEDVPTQIAGSGEITVVKTATYGTEASSIARIIVTFEKPYETDISIQDGTRLLVRVIEASPQEAAPLEDNLTEPDDPSTEGGNAKLVDVPNEEVKPSDGKPEQPVGKKADVLDRKPQRKQELAEKPSNKALETQKSTPRLRSKNKEPVRTLEFLGFKQAGSTTRVYFRTDRPVQFHVQEISDTQVRVVIENTLIGENRNRLALDTSYFDSPVQRINPFQESGKTVVAEIELRAAATFRTRQEGNEVYVDFERR